MEHSVTFMEGAPDMETVFGVLLILLGILVFLVATAITLLIWCKLFGKAGYSWALGLLMILPIVNIIMPFFLAFADWPIRKELRRLKQQQETPRT
jgi:uncharacterized membrane protein